MTLPVIADCFRVTVEWGSQNGVTPRNVFHVSSTSDDVTAIGAAILGAYQEGQWTAMHNGFEQLNLAILPLDGSTATTLIDAVGTPNSTGASTGDMVPEAALIMSFATGLRGPAHRGRIYIGPVGESEIDSGKIQGDFGATADAWAAFQDALIASSPSCALVVASYKHATMAQVHTIVGKGDVATQRRRLLQTR
jgi:hypothetical protein